MKNATKCLCLLICMFGTNMLFSQFFERQLVSSAGFLFENNQISLSSTLGDIAIKTAKSDELFLTQGFQQPNIEDLTGILFIKDKNLEIVLFPNPTFDKITLKFLSEDNFFLEYQIFDISGKEVSHSVFINLDKQNTQIIDLSGFESGQYYLVIFDEEKLAIKTLGIQKL